MGFTTLKGKELTFGDSVGERALLEPFVRDCTVKCVVDGELWALERKAYEEVIRDALSGTIASHVAALSTGDDAAVGPEAMATVAAAVDVT